LLLAGEARRRQVLEQLRPLHAGFHLDQPALGVERQHLVHLPDIEQHAVGGELLRAHGVAAAGDAQRTLLGPRQLHRAAHRVDRRRFDNAEHARRVELRVHVVDEDALGLGLRLGLLRESRAGPCGGNATETKELPAADHPSPPVVVVRDSERYSNHRTWRTIGACCSGLSRRRHAGISQLYRASFPIDSF